jgi:hypothetical protein
MDGKFFISILTLLHVHIKNWIKDQYAIGLFILCQYAVKNSIYFLIITSFKLFCAINILQTSCIFIKKP